MVAGATLIADEWVKLFKSKVEKIKQRKHVGVILFVLLVCCLMGLLLPSVGMRQFSTEVFQRTFAYGIETYGANGGLVFAHSCGKKGKR